MNNKAVIIGSGFAGMSAASFMAKSGWDVTVIEKNEGPGGRARQLAEEGFTFDMGPSWYWMPDVFERYFAQFGRDVNDYYNLKRLDPSYRVIWEKGFTDIPAGLDNTAALFESWEPGAAARLRRFMEGAAYKYRVGMQKLVFKPGLTVKEFNDPDIFRGVLKLDVFRSMKKHVHRYFRDARIRQLMEFPVLFLGALPEKTPALYSLMNYADTVGGTWYPEGGMYSIVRGMHRLAVQLGVKFRFNEAATGFRIPHNSVTSVLTVKGAYAADVVIAGADYHHVEQQLLPPEKRSYSASYWNKREMAPSCLLYYVGLNRKLKNIRHHNLFFDSDFGKHGREIYETKKWPSEPLFYVCVNSVTDDTVAPSGCENLFFLIPVAAGLTGDDESLREQYFTTILERFSRHVGEDVCNSIVYKKTFGITDFMSEYNSFRGNAYGLANTLLQTAVLKPKCRSNKIKNLYYTGQLTVPGPGVPPSLISGEVVASLVNADLNDML